MDYLHRQRPTHVLLLPTGTEAPHWIEDREEVFTEYEDTGFEPRLEWLYRVLECRAVDWRNLPGLGHLWFDDEGLLTNRPLNYSGTMLYQSVYDLQNVITGTAVLIVNPGVASKMVEDLVAAMKRVLETAKGGVH